MDLSPSRSPLAALWPRRLRHQMLVLLVAVMLVAIAVVFVALCTSMRYR